MSRSECMPIEVVSLMSDASVAQRRLPYPYEAMLAICSDLDETADRRVYWETARFLNTTGSTAMGPGVGLEVGNSIYFDMPIGAFSYWNTDDAGREMVRSLIRSGHIDCLHSYGDLAKTRGLAEMALAELARFGCWLQVWVDHATAPTNFGPDIMLGHGDEPGHEAYHADLTTAFGIRYVWRGRVTSVTGQDIPARMTGLWSPRHPLASGKTLAKELAKRVWGSRDGKYAMHRPNRVLRAERLRDGAPIFEFIRSNPHWGGVSCCETARCIDQVLTNEMLKRLIDRQGVCILYTHLGKVLDQAVPFQPAAVAAFRRLARLHHAGRLLVTTTRRALGYLAARDWVAWSASRSANEVTIDLRMPCGEGFPAGAIEKTDLAGLTFQLPDDVACRVMIDGILLENVQVNPPDRTGRPSVTIPWGFLDFPSL
ncbi:MAG: hypothetical protein HQ546_04900 [Planctomycetes bacterium]|nr:hypothetical protein [Planctomycetota bacterium]